MNYIDKSFSGIGRFLLSGVPEGYDALVLAESLAEKPPGSVHLHIARDATRMAAMADALSFYASDLRVVSFPAWDCLPYDRVSPNREIVSERIDVLSHLAHREDRNASLESARLIVLTSVNATLQRVPDRETIRNAARDFAVGSRVGLDELGDFFTQNGFERVGTVREPGEYAVRGGILDVYPPGEEFPLRLDLFGDEIDAMRAFDPITQRTTQKIDGFSLKPASEVFLDEASISRFRAGYRDAFGSVTDDPLYVGVTEGRKQIGMEHWLPLFHDRLETLLDYLPGASVTLDNDSDQVRDGRLEMIADYYDARTTFLENSKAHQTSGQPPYRPLPTDRMYLSAREFEKALDGRLVGLVSPFAAPEGIASSVFADVLSMGARRIPEFAAARAQAATTGREDDSPAETVFDTVRVRLKNDIDAGRRAVITAFTQGSRERLGQLLRDNNIPGIVPIDNWQAAIALPPSAIGLAVLPIENGFAAEDLVLITEQDILGDRIVRPDRKRRRAENFIADVSEIAMGDLVVHIEHGIGRYDGLETLSVAGAPHDCLRVVYSGEDRLYVPVENVEVLSRYGSGDMPASLDKLGGAAWQARKSRMKARLRDIADQLIKIAAQRTLRPAVKIEIPDDLYQEFAARFPYTETDDQADAIADTLTDLKSGNAMR